MVETIYFGTCALNRLTDIQTQPRVRAEAEAVDDALAMVAVHKVHWVASDALYTELSRNPDPIKRSASLPLLDAALLRVQTSVSMVQRAGQFEVDGFGAFDALHLSICLESGVDFLLTVDDRFVRRAARRADLGPLKVLNPIDWTARNIVWPLKP